MLKTPIPPEERLHSNYRWVLLGMASLTSMLVFAMPEMSLPVLFSEISADLNLSLVQIGFIWGVGSLTGMFVGLLAGTIGDRFGSRRSMILSCLLTGLFAILRGTTINFPTFMLASFVVGMVQAGIPIYVNKVAIEWFDRRQLGTAAGMISAGFASGLTLGPLIAASVLSPALGGWRHVMFFYGGLSLVIGLLWWLLYPKEEAAGAGKTRRFVPLKEGLPHVLCLRQVWIIGLGSLGVRACVSGMTGYLPTYLREIGWAPAVAGNALAAFFAMSLLGVIPISMMSDRFRNRRSFLMVASLMLATGTGLLSVVDGILVWPAVMFAGVVFDAFMAIYNTSVMEVEGVGSMYAGTALGFAGLLRNIGGTISPPLGNALAVTFGLRVPFAFWGLAAVGGFLVFTRLAPRRKLKQGE